MEHDTKLRGSGKWKGNEHSCRGVALKNQISRQAGIRRCRFRGAGGGLRGGRSAAPPKNSVQEKHTASSFAALDFISGWPTKGICSNVCFPLSPVNCEGCSWVASFLPSSIPFPFLSCPCPSCSFSVLPSRPKKGRRALIKSNNPHLAGGEQQI